VQILGGVFFEMEAGDADALLCTAVIDFDPAVGGQRQFVLGDLVAFGQIRIEIILASEARMLVDGAVQCQRGAHGQFDGAFVQNRKGAGESKAYGTDIRIGRIAEVGRAAAENLGVRQKLDVDLQADDGLVFREQFGSDGRLFLR